MMKSFIITMVSAIIVIILIVTIGTWAIKRHDKQEWNNGYCQCGGKWKLYCIDNERGNTYVYYTCNECEKIIERYR